MTTALKARPTTYNGIEMRSRLEARVAAWLDDVAAWQQAKSDVEPLRWQYEPRAYASGGKQYLPDFRLDGIRDPHGQPRTFYLEVKGDLPEYDAMKTLAGRMETILTADPMAGLLIGDSRGMEKGFFLVSRHFYLSLLMRCPWHMGNLFLAGEVGRDLITYVGRCAEDCEGIAYRPGDVAWPRIGLPEYGS